MAAERPAMLGAAVPGVELISVSKRFGPVTAVDDLSLAVQPGEFLTLLGPSGCGKTTTLRLIGGFTQPASGEIRIGGERMTGRPPHLRPVNTVFQNYALFPHMTVADNIAYSLRLAGSVRRERERRVSEALDLVHLPRIERRKPAELSGGQQQRVALARALVNRPAVLLLDEPLGALDLGLRRSMQLELKRVQREAGVTFVYVTHDQEEALLMSDRIAVMAAGRILQVGTPAEVYDAPLTPFVAGFVGQSNLLAGTLRSADNGIGVVDVPAIGQLSGRLAGTASAGATVTLAIRPERIELQSRSDATPRNDWQELVGTLVEMAYVGTHWRISVLLGDGTALVAHRPSGREVDGEPRPGDRVALRWRISDAMVLVS
ncbi:MAG: ABC transporter ATP-binding protein [Chloroflexota bacterium]|nr:ABC transporter ATP-binding protein [Chloroflexota bacterium]